MAVAVPACTVSCDRFGRNRPQETEPETLGFSCSGARRADAAPPAIRWGRWEGPWSGPETPAPVDGAAPHSPDPRGGAGAGGVFGGSVAPGDGKWGSAWRALLLVVREGSCAVCILYLKWLGGNITNKVKIGSKVSDIQGQPGSKTHTPS